MEPSLILLASLVVRVTAVLVVALLLVRLGRSFAASLRYEAVVMAMAATLVIPLLMFLVPSWNVLPMVPEVWRGAQDATLQESTLGSVLEAPTGNPGSAAHLAAENPVGEAVAFAARTVRALSLTQILILVWGLGAMLILLRSMQARWVLSRWWNQAQALDASGWEDVLDEAGDRVFLTRHVDVRQLPGISSPMTWGLWQPKLLLPEDATDWSRERKLNAVMHEFVHVRRRDAWHDLMSVLFVSLFWFHPLSWMLRQQLWVQREASCDDSVLALGANPQEYAQMLIDVAKEMRSLRGVPQVAMTISRPSQLEGRILSVLDSTNARRAFKPLHQRMLAAGWVVLAVVVSAMSPAPASSQHELVREWTQETENGKATEPAMPSAEIQPQYSGMDAASAIGDVARIDSPLDTEAAGAADKRMEMGTGEPDLEKTVEDFFAITGMRMADAALSELGRSVATVDWSAWLEKSGINLTEVQVALEDVDTGTENMPLDQAIEEMGARIQTAVITEMETVIRENPGTEKARRAVKALIEIDSPASRAALDRLDIHQLPR